MRIRYGYYIVIAGFVLVGLSFVASLMKFTMAADVSSVFGLITGVVGTLVGAFFGVQVGSQGKEKAENARNNAEKVSRHLAAIGGSAAESYLRELESKK
jgi:hypothetical protein